MAPRDGITDRSAAPLRTLIGLAEAGPARLLAIQFSLGAKALPAYLAPVYLAEVVRIVSVDGGRICVACCGSAWPTARCWWPTRRGRC